MSKPTPSSSYFLAVPAVLSLLTLVGCIGDLNNLRTGDAGLSKSDADTATGGPGPDAKPDSNADADGDLPSPPDLPRQEVARDLADGQQGDVTKPDDTTPRPDDASSDPARSDLPRVTGPDSADGVRDVGKPDLGPDTVDAPSDPAPPQEPVPGKCPTLTTPNNGSVAAPNLSAGGEATYSCLSGYNMTGGTVKRTCQSDGTWSGSAPACTPVDCGALTSPTNGNVSVPSTTYNGKATYSCSSSYSLSGGTERTCQSNGAWSGSAPTCTLADCGSLPSPTNGSVNTPSTTLNATATYSCSSGFDRVGAETRTCQANGTWSGSAPTCSCPRTLCGSSCVDLQTSTSHCGACNAGCSASSPSSAQCTAGKCLVTLASNQSKPRRLAVDGSSVYWTCTDGGTVMKVGRGGGSTTTLASGQNQPSDIAIDGSSVYWTNASSSSGSVNKVSHSGGTPTSIATGQAVPTALVLDSTYAYWSNDGDDSIMRGPLDGSSPPTQWVPSAGPNISYLAVRSSNVYWTTTVDNGAVSNVQTVSPASVTPLASGLAQPHGITTDATYVYWVNFAGGTVMRLPLGGGQDPTTLVSGQSSPRAIALDGSGIYWTNSGDGTVMKASLTGANPTTIATGQDTPAHIVVDSSSVYWTTYGGTVMKLTPK